MAKIETKKYRFIFCCNILISFVFSKGLPVEVVKGNKNMKKLTPRERFILALERQTLSGCVPHFELVFFFDDGSFRKGSSFAQEV